MLQTLKNWINKRAIEMEEAARMVHFDYSKEDDFGLQNSLHGFQLLEKGYSKKIRHVLRSRPIDFSDVHIDVFDYHYTVSAGNSSKTHKQTVFFLQSKDLKLPQFYMRPEHFFHKIAAFLGWDDIDFEEHPVFSDQYHLKGDNEKAIRAMMDDQTLHFFTIEKDWSLEGMGHYLIFYASSKRFSKHDIQWFIDKGLEVYAHLVKEA